MPFEQRATPDESLFNSANGVAKETGDVSEVYVLRASSDACELGAVTAWHLDYRSAANLTLATRFELRPDDNILIAENPATKWDRTIQQITPSLITTTIAVAAN